jgi:DNA-binding CsgD family transcriptional regulator
MSAFVLVVAQLLFDDDDRAWSLFSEFWEKEQNPKMHAGPGETVALVPVPVLRWTPLAAITADLALSDDPFQMINRQPELHRREKDQQLRAFLRGLNPAKREIARLLAEGLDNQSIATRRGRSMSTVTSQIKEIYDEWRSFFGVTPASAPVRDQIVAELSGYFSRNRGEVR